MPTEYPEPLAAGTRLAMAGLAYDRGTSGRATFLGDDWCFSGRERWQPGRRSRADCCSQALGPARHVHARACLPRGAQ